MMALSSQGTTRRRARPATFASRIGQSTGALLNPAGLAAHGPGHCWGARAGLAGPARAGPLGMDTGREKPGTQS